MAFTGNFVTTSFKLDLLGAKHNFTSGSGHSFKMALYGTAATLDTTTTAYTTSNEIAATGTYVAGGKALVLESSPAHPRVPSGVTAVADFVDLTWAASTISAYGALIYNVTAGNNSVVVLDFLGLKASSSGDFVVQFPVADATNAIIRIN